MEIGSFIYDLRMTIRQLTHDLRFYAHMNGIGWYLCAVIARAPEERYVYNKTAFLSLAPLSRVRKQTTNWTKDTWRKV